MEHKHDTRPSFTRRLVASAAIALLVAACGGGSDPHDDDDHPYAPIDTSGRLALSEDGAARLHVLDLDDNTSTGYTLKHAASAVYASPGLRYAAVLQGAGGVVQFVDGGVWQEDHGDHLHDYKQASRLMASEIAGSRPSHFNANQDGQAALYLDGEGATPAGVRLLTDDSIASATAAIASLTLDAPLHGLALPHGNALLAAHRAADAGSANPTHLRVYQRAGTTYSAGNLLATRCDNMHGGASVGPHAVVGCSDGVLLATHGAAGDPVSSKVGTPIRITTVVSHPKPSSHAFIGFGNVGSPATTTRFFAIDTAAGGSAQELTSADWTATSLRRAHGFDRSGQQFFVLDQAGSLHVWKHGASGWARAAAPLAGVVPAMPASAPFPVLATSGARDELYVTDPVAKQVVVVDSAALTVKARTPLGFTPAQATWLGIPR